MSEQHSSSDRKPRIGWPGRILIGLFLLLAVFLAPIAQIFVQELLVEPVAFAWWAIKLGLRSISQALIWQVVVGIAALVSLVSLLRGIRRSRSSTETPIPKVGPIELLAQDIERTERRSTFFKWQVANRLAKLARAIAIRNQITDTTAPTKASDFDAPAPVQDYLAAGLNGSFIDHQPRRFFAPKIKTPFEIDLNRVIEFLESQME